MNSVTPESIVYINDEIYEKQYKIVLKDTLNERVEDLISQGIIITEIQKTDHPFVDITCLVPKRE